MEKLTISEALDRIGMTKTITLISILTGITICFNGFDYMIVSFSMPQIKAEWGLDSVQTGALSSWGTFGMIFGTLACGRLADMFGRRIVTVAFVGLFSLATFPASSSTATRFTACSDSCAGSVLAPRYPSSRHPSLNTARQIIGAGWLLRGRASMPWAICWPALPLLSSYRISDGESAIYSGVCRSSMHFGYGSSSPKPHFGSCRKEGIGRQPMCSTSFSREAKLRKT